ncbi:MAG: hypothetical protein HZB42_13395 [Sphingobacteriales bacterium]|nr:hypothetical protein [Sphingobacteriales bacterium]
MKQLLISALLAVFVLGCNKVKNTASDDPTPVANFRIVNTVEDGTVMEGTALQFENNSQCADSYEWDFGNGTMCYDRTPTNIVYRQCPTTYCIRLTVRTRHGRTATYSYCVRVRCR